VNWTDPAVIRGYVKGYFVHPDPHVWEPLADVLVRVTLSPDYPRWARSAALTFQMIYQQPVRHCRPVCSRKGTCRNANVEEADR
jgi:hypothetical protein